MFPLNTVLLPGMALPLHVFEPRYRQLVRDCLVGIPEFGVVLIERGSEVGGDDARTDAGTVARILRAGELPDGRWVLQTLGVRRVRVEVWLEDDPYPRAEVIDWPDPPPGAATDLAAEHAAIATLLRRASALRTELGEPAPPIDIEFNDDPVLAGYQMAAAAALGPADRQAVLTASTPTARSELLAEMLGADIEVLEARLALG